MIIERYHRKIIRITETWCNKENLDSELSLTGYNFIRKDKAGSKGVGEDILLYVHQSLDATPCYNFDTVEMESSLWCEVKLNDKDNLYRSPNSCTENYNALSYQLLMTASLKLNQYSHNFCEINWNHSTVDAGLNSGPHKFFDLTQDLIWVQHVKKPTRHREGQKSSMLDLIFVKDENDIDFIEQQLGRVTMTACYYGYTSADQIILSQPKRN